MPGATPVKGLHKVKRKLADGSTRTHYYAWRGGPAIHAEFGTDAFWIEYGEAKRNASGHREKTLPDLIDEFAGSLAFRGLARSTQESYLYAYALAKKQWAALPVRLTQQRGFRRRVEDWRDQFTPAKADKMVAALSRVFSYAVKGEILDRNPCLGVGTLYTGSRRDAVWSREQIALFRAKAPAHVLLAFELALGTGQRQGDVLGLTWRDYDGTHLRFEQEKTGKRVRVKVHAHLKALIDQQPRGTLRIATNSRGRPWTRDGFKTTWGKTLTALGIEGVTFHDLRGTFIVERRREGSKVEDIAQITGHSISEVRSTLEKHYMASDQGLSDAVILRMDRNTGGTKV